MFKLFAILFLISSCHFGEKTTDFGDKYKIEKKYQNENEDISIIHENKTLYVVGTVEDSEDVEYRFAKISKQNEHKEVEIINELSTCEKYNHTGDIWLEKKIKAKLFFDSHIKSKNFIIYTTCGRVYIFGKYINEDEIEKVTDTIANTKHVTKVINYAQDIKNPN